LNLQSEDTRESSLHQIFVLEKRNSELLQRAATATLPGPHEIGRSLLPLNRRTIRFLKLSSSSSNAVLDYTDEETQAS
jgi:hypothetical protein